MRAKWTVLCLTTLMSACATHAEQTRAHFIPGGLGVETNRPILLTTSQQTRAYCVDAQVLVCESESGGRLGPFRCVCPIESVGREAKLQHH
jgi:hypothetical protein